MTSIRSPFYFDLLRFTLLNYDIRVVQYLDDGSSVLVCAMLSCLHKERQQQSSSNQRSNSSSNSTSQQQKYISIGLVFEISTRNGRATLSKILQPPQPKHTNTKIIAHKQLVTLSINLAKYVLKSHSFPSALGSQGTQLTNKGVLLGSSLQQLHNPWSPILLVNDERQT